LILKYLSNWTHQASVDSIVTGTYALNIHMVHFCHLPDGFLDMLDGLVIFISEKLMFQFVE
jgi:hypothetical protein